MKFSDMFRKKADGSDPEIPKELEGLSTEDLVSAVQSQGKVAELETKLNEASEQLSEFDNMKARLTSIEANQPKREPDSNQPKRPTSVLVNEDEAFAQRLGPAVMMSMHAAAQTARMAAREKINGKFKIGDVGAFDKYESEINELLKSVPLQEQIYPQTFENALNVILGRNMSTILQEQSKTGGKFFVESGVAPTGGQPSPKTEDGLTDAEKKIAASMKMTPEQYIEQKKGMKFVNV